MSEFKVAPHWIFIKLGQIASRITKGSSPKWQGFDYCDEGILFVRSQNVGWGYLELEDIACLPEAFNQKEKKSILQENDILINIVGASIGRVALGNKLVEGGNINQAVALVRLKSDCSCEPSFIVNFMLSEVGQTQLHRYKKDIARANLSLQDINNIFIALPPLPEQKSIAHTLRTIQKAKETRQRELELERERKAALMQYLFTHGTIDESTNLQETRFGKVPQHWKIISLDECAFVQTGTAKGRKLKNGETVTLPYLRVANVQDGYLDLSEIKEITIRKSEIQRYTLQVNDVVLTEGGDADKLGRGFIWKGEIPNCLHQNHIFAVRTYQDRLLPRYLAYLVQSNYGKAYFLSVAHRTTNLASINSTKLKKFPTLVPEVNEQKEIVEILEICDRKISSLEKEIAILDELFHAMLEQLMTGKISTKHLSEIHL